MATNQSDLNVNIEGKDNLTPTLNRSLSTIIRYVGAVSSALAALDIASFPVKSIRDFQRQLADVQKTTNFTAAELDQLGDSLIKLSTRIDISATDLAKIAAAAGQMGLGRDGVAGVVAFTDSVSRMASVLDISVEDAGMAVGKLVSIFKVPIAQVESLSSAFNQVSNNSTATGAQLIDVAKRVGDAAGAFKNYADAIGIAATAIDLGSSPEVAGTSLAKVFADMQGKAEKFAQFMGTSTKDWVDRIQTDGIQAYKDYLAKLRTLSGDAQQAAIRDLSGTGRIGKLVTQMVRDTSNAILDRNLKNAYDGMRSGTSALQEQANIINTIDYRAKLAANSFRNLGIAAGDQFAKPLTAMLIEIADGLQNPSVISFAQKVGQAFLSLFQMLESGTKFVASLNVNWENFITLAKALAELKLVEWGAGFIARLTGISSGLQLIAKRAAEAKVALKETGSATGVMLGAEAGMVGGSQYALSQAKAAANPGAYQTFKDNNPQIQQMKALRKESDAYNATLAARAAAETELFDAENMRAALVSKQQEAYASKIAGVESVVPQAKAVAAAQAALLAAQEKGQADIAAAQATLNTKLEASEEAHQQRVLAIEEEYAAKRKAMRGHVSSNRMAALKEEEATLLAQEETYFARSLRGTDQYYSALLAKAEAAAVARNAAAAQNVTQTQVAYGTAAAAAGVTASAMDYTTTTAQINRMNKTVDEAKDKLQTTTQAAVNAELTFDKLGNRVGMLKAGFSLFLSVLSKFALWGTIIYTIADMLGWVDKLTALFPKFSDALGFTSEAQRKLAQDIKETNDKLKAQQKLVEDQTKKYLDMTDALTHLLKPENLKAWTEMLSGGSATTNSAQQALKEIMDAAKGAMNIMDNNKQKIDLLPFNRQDIEIQFNAMATSYQAALNKMDAARKKLSSQQANLVDNPNDVNAIGAYVTPAMRQYARAKAELDGISKQMADLQNQGAAIGPVFEKALAASADKAKTDFGTVATYVSKLFTEQSADLYKKLVTPLADLQDKLAALNTQRDALFKTQGELAKYTNPTDAQKAQQAQNAKDIDDNTIQIQALNGQIFQATDNIIKMIETMKKTPGLAPDVLASYENLLLIFKQSAAWANTMVASIDRTRGMGITLTGGFKLPTAPGSTGDANYEKDQNRAAKARIALLKAEAEAEAALVKDAGAERLKELEHTNSKGLIAIKDFYKQKLAIEMEDNAEAIRIAQIELQGIQDEMKTQTDKVAKIQSQAAIARVQGQISLLEQQRGNLSKQNARDEEDAIRAFKDRLADESLKVSQLLGNSTDPQLFRQALQVYADQYRVFLNQLKVEAKDKPQLLPLIDAIQQSLQLRALGDTIDYITKKADTASAHFDEFANQMTAMQQAGVLTTQQAAKAIEAARAEQAKFYEDALQKAQVALSSQKAGSQEWLVAANNVEALRTKVLQYQADAVATAKGINDGITSSLSDAINNWTGSLSSFKDVATSFLTDVAKQIKQTFSKDAAEGLMQALGSSGGGGIGGFLSGFLGKGAPSPGSSLNNPIYAFITNPGGGTDFTGSALNIANWAGSASKVSLGSGGDLATNSLDNVVTTFSSKLSTTTDGIVDSMSGIFKGLGSGLMNVFSGLFSSLPGGGLGAFLTGMWHTGGIAGYGGGMQRMVPLGAFAGAARYHSGGIAGLQPDEVPAVLKRGEEILTPNDPRHRSNGDQTGGDQVTNVWVVSPDQQPAMGPNDVIVTVGDNISRNGSLKKLIQSIRR